MDNNFKKRLIEVRNACGMSGYSFAKKLNIPQPTYLRYETGEQKPSAKLISALVLLFNVNVYWLFTGEGKMFFRPDENTLERRFEKGYEQEVLTFGKRLSLLQSKHNFLDREMATLLGISERNYVSLVRCKTQPTIDILTKLKQNFKVSIDYLLFGDY